MKNHFIGFLLLIATTLASSASNVEFAILGIAETRGGEQILVGRSWREDSPRRIEARLRATEDIPAGKVVAKAYFYDADKKLIHTYDKPCMRWMKTSKGFEEIGLPPVLKKHETIRVYFALTPELLKLNPKTTLVVFGDSSRVVVRSRSEGSALDFNFPEKSRATEAPK